LSLLTTQLAAVDPNNVGGFRIEDGLADDRLEFCLSKYSGNLKHLAAAKAVPFCPLPVRPPASSTAIYRIKYPSTHLQLP
jgi:hypothetical protein